MGKTGESWGSMTAVKKERPGLLVLRDQLGAPVRASGDGAAKRDGRATGLVSVVLLGLVAGSLVPAAFPAAEVLGAADVAFDSEAFGVATTLALADDGATGRRSALRKAATPALVRS